MAITDFRIGRTTQTTARISVRSDATESITLNINGGTPSEAADTSVNNGWVVFDVTGLTAGTSYPFTVGSFSGAVTTKPATATRRTITFSCIEPSVDNIAIRSILAEAPDTVISVGDTPYSATAINRWGQNASGTDTSMANSKDVSVYRTSHLQCARMPSFRRLVESVEFLYVPDDHEYCFDNPSPTDLTGYQSGVGGAGSAIQDDLDAAWDAALTVIGEFSIGNPDSAIPGYFKWTEGNTEHFTFDCIRDRSPVSATDDVSKIMLSAEVEEALIADVIASSADFKVIHTPKELFKGGVNTDTWHFYQTQRNRILLGIAATTTVVWSAGDAHLPNVQYAPPDALFPGSPAVVCFVGCPIGQQLNASQGDPAGEGQYQYAIWKRGDNDNEWPVGESKAYTRIDDDGDRLVVALRDVFAGGHHEPAGTLYQMTFVAGSNVPLEFMGGGDDGRRKLLGFLGRR